MDFKEAMSALEGMDFDGKDGVLKALRENNSAKNTEAATAKKEFEDFQKSVTRQMEAQNKVLQGFKENFATLAKATGKDIPNVDEIDVNVLAKDFQALQEDYNSMKTERETQAKEALELRKKNAIMKEFDSLNIHEDYRDRFLGMYSPEFTFDSSNQLVREDGTRAADFLKAEFEGKDAFIKNSMKGGAGVDSPVGGMKGANETHQRVLNAYQKATT